MKHCFFLIFILAANLVLTSIVSAAPTLYDSILITVNNRIITKNEVELRMFAESRNRNKSLKSDEDAPKIREKIVNSLIEEALLDIRADEMLITISEDTLERESNNFRKARKMDIIQFEDFLEQQHLTLTDFKKALKKNYRRNQVLEVEVRSQIVISNADLEKVFQKKNKGKKRIKARHILIQLAPDAPENEVAAARTKIIEIKKSIEQGADFEEEAVKWSQDPSAKTNKGNLGFFERQDMVKEFANVAFELPLNKISDPVRSPFGFHIIEVLKIASTSEQDFEAIKSRIYKQEFQKLFYKKYKTYLQKLKAKASIVFNN